MANVIPETMRRDTERVERARFIFTGAVVGLICAAVAFALLLPGYLATLLGSQHAVSALGVVSPAQQSNDAGAIARTNALLNILAPIAAASSTPTDAIAEALALRPSGVRVDQVIYHTGKPSSLMISGAADTNGEINAYQTALSADPRFVSVSIPVGALVGLDGGRFSITLAGTF